MSNRSLLITRLQNISPELQAELNYYLNDIDHEEEYDLADAFSDYFYFIDSRGNLTAELKKILAEIGYCVPVDISTIQVSRGKKYWFILNNQHYDCISSWENG